MKRKHCGLIGDIGLKSRVDEPGFVFKKKNFHQFVHAPSHFIL